MRRKLIGAGVTMTNISWFHGGSSRPMDNASRCEIAAKWHFA